MIVALVGLASFVLVAWLVFPGVFGNSRRSINSPRRLFRSLCQAHRLKWSDRRLLRQLARGRGLGDASRLFVDPLCFERESLRGGLHARADRIAELRRQLFGS